MRITEPRPSFAHRQVARSAAVPLARRVPLLLGLLIVPLLALLGGCVAAVPPSAPGYSYVCHAGVYQCTLPAQYRLGTRCSCPALGAPSFGRVG